jgi:hypothetical protein
MENDELKLRLGQILAEEEGDGDIDWHSVESRSTALLGELQMPIPLVVDEYLRGFERRRNDAMFGRAQRSELLLFLRGSAKPGA